MPGFYEKGEAAYATRQVKLQEGTGFYEPIKKLKLKTFSSVKRGSLIKGTDKEIVLKADNRVFGHMLLIAQNRKLDMKEILCYPLGRKPWALVNADGTLKKTGKQNSIHILQSKLILLTCQMVQAQLSLMLWE